MRAGTKTLRDSGIDALRYALIFGGLIAIMLMIANLEKPAHRFSSSHHTVAQISP